MSYVILNLKFHERQLFGVASILGASLGMVGGAMGRSWNPPKLTPHVPGLVQPKRRATAFRAIAAGGFFFLLINLLLAVLGLFGYGGLIGILVISAAIWAVVQRVLKWAHG